MITDPPSAWLALPVGFSLSVLIVAAFGGDGSLVPFALYVLVVTVVGTVGMRNAVVGENIGLSLLALVPGALALAFVLFAVQEVARAGPPSVVLLAILLAAATSNGVICGYYVSLIVTFERQMRAEPSTNNEATTRHR